MKIKILARTWRPLGTTVLLYLLCFIQNELVKIRKGFSEFLEKFRRKDEWPIDLSGLKTVVEWYLCHNLCALICTFFCEHYFHKNAFQ